MIGSNIVEAMKFTQNISKYVDTSRYLIADKGSAGRSDLISACRAQLSRTTGARLEGFIKPDIIAKMAKEVNDHSHLSDVISNRQNPYMSDGH